MNNYPDDPRINQSKIKLFLDHDWSIAKAKAEEEHKPSAAMALGSLVHGIVELRGQVPYNFEVAPYADFRKKEAREWRNQKQAEGVTIIKQDELDQGIAMANNILNNATPELRQIINDKDSKREEAYFDSEHKALLDCVSSDGEVGIDYKTTSATSADQFMLDVRKYHYDLQAAHYMNMSYVSNFYYVAVSSVKPYPVWCFKCSDSFIDGGQHKLSRALDRFHNKLEGCLNVL